MPSKPRFLLRILRHRLNRQPRVCPYCGGSAYLKLLRRKKIVLDILKCEACRLVFRWPTDTPEESDAYYQDDYALECAQVRLPGREELQEWMEKNFAGTPLDLEAKIRVLKAIRPTARVLDYGCSWGYGTHQLAQHGYRAVGYEISKPRARFAREKLRLETFDSFDQLKALPPKTFDVIFSHHVLEHLTNLKDTLDLTARLLADGGLAFHVLPNFTGKAALDGLWLQWIGEEHPLAPTIEFFALNLPKHGFAKVEFASSPFDDILAAALRHQGRQPLQTEGDELLVLALKQA